MRQELRRTIVNPLSIVGIAMAVFAAVIIVALLLLGLSGLVTNPYTGILAFIIGPIVLILGLILIPVGIIVERHRHPHLRTFPIIDLNHPGQQFKLAVFSIATFVVLLLMATTTYGAAQFMESDFFCTKVCHLVMQPEDVGHATSPHARVACVNCHIGPGAEWYVRSKITGAGQVKAVATRTYPRPIPVPVESLRPARQTCEQCHWPERFHGDTLRLFVYYTADEQNTPQNQSVIFHVGGAEVGRGIHWHTAAGVWYVSLKPDQTEVGWVRVENLDGTVDEYASPDRANEITPERIRSDQRFMDCIDCHNRASHQFTPVPEALDQAIFFGNIDRKLPYIKRQAVQAVGDMSKAPSPQEYQEALRRIEEIEAYYQTQYPTVYQQSRAEIQQAVAQIRQIYESSIFLHMRVTPLTYPRFNKHDGCFRCHGTLVGVSERVVGQKVGIECDKCHLFAPPGLSEEGSLVPPQSVVPQPTVPPRSTPVVATPAATTSSATATPPRFPSITPSAAIPTATASPRSPGR